MWKYLKGFNNKTTFTGLSMIATGLLGLKYHWLEPGEAIQTIGSGLGLVFLRRAVEKGSSTR